ncbi:MAG: LytTR family DNA-binding domain-containing protein [Saprospiraceae bacterium]|nr:LytTR family DNA-binding domain-containing protein [Saprospiraceae bacterium]
MIKALIIEDEVRNQRMLNQLLEVHCPSVQIIGFCERIEDSINQINNLKPDLIFLDIQLKDGSGFDILSRLDKHIPKIIFTTAYDQYAIKAFKYSAIDYLLKPIITDELKAAVKKCTQDSEFDILKIRNLLEQINPKKEEYLSISTQKTTEYLRISEIIRFEAQGSYCLICMKDGSKHMISKVLKEFVPKLANQGFFRVHQSHFINLKYAKSYNKGDQIINMIDGSQVTVSRQIKGDFVKEMTRRSLD